MAASHALVIGGSLAGMLTARVLANHFAQVTIVERDQLPEGPEHRPGVPQARHLHILLVRGQQIIDQLFPGILDELTAAGAEPVDAADDLAWYTPAGWGIRFHSGLLVRVCSRNLLDWAVRRRLAALPQVRFLPGCEVAGLLAHPNGTALAGVTLRSPSEERLEADLVADASGRRSRMPQWLEALGYPAPEETVVNAHLGYASRLYRRPPAFHADWKGLFIQAAPPKRTRGGVVLPIEEGRWLVTLGGGGGDYPPTDDDGFLEFARKLVSPLLYDAIRQAEPLSPIAGFRATENRLRHYERLSRWPGRCLVVGDAACCFNPVYGQGMTTAALGAMLLDQTLRESHGDLDSLGGRFQRRLAQVNETPWLLATSEDYRYRTTEGKPPGRLTRLMHGYMSGVLQRGTVSVYVRQRLLEVFHMLRRPGSLFHPRILAEVALTTVPQRPRLRQE
jgi:2-polyprenyl-6-methoxyphenol hydroxylase-like FAD-dependent oxidoreductase